MFKVTFQLDYPSFALSPNSHRGWRVKHDAAQAAKAEGRYKLMSAMDGLPAPDPEGDVILSFVFHPKNDENRHKRDSDNMFCSMKHHIDGIALALRMDDNRFEYRFKKADPVDAPFVAVTVEYEPLPFAEMER